MKVSFQKGKLKKAEKKAFDTFAQNTYLFDKFFGRTVVPIDKWEGSLLESADFAIQHFHYSAEKKELADFADWLDSFTQTEKFIRLSTAYIEIQKKLLHESDPDKRWNLMKQARQLKEEL